MPIIMPLESLEFFETRKDRKAKIKPPPCAECGIIKESAPVYKVWKGKEYCLSCARKMDILNKPGDGTEFDLGRE